MNLATPPAKYDPGDQARLRQAVARADTGNFKKGQDVELARGERLIMRSPNGNRWVVGVSNAGALTVTGPL